MNDQDFQSIKNLKWLALKVALIKKLKRNRYANRLYRL